MFLYTNLFSRSMRVYFRRIQVGKWWLERQLHSVNRWLPASSKIRRFDIRLKPFIWLLEAILIVWLYFAQYKRQSKVQRQRC